MGTCKEAQSLSLPLGSWVEKGLPALPSGYLLCPPNMSEDASKCAWSTELAVLFNPPSRCGAPRCQPRASLPQGAHSLWSGVTG